MIPFFLDSSSYTIGLLLLISIIFFRKTLSVKLQKNGMAKVSFTLLFLILIAVIYSNLISEQISQDGNSEWRMVVWLNEIASLRQSHYLGVGFGSAYVSTDILSKTANINMYTNNELNNFLYGIFLVGNHNSILNMFYRMGVAGGVVFVILQIVILKWSLKQSSNHVNTKFNDYIWWANANYIFNFIVIALNPGLEMMQFSIGYQLSLAVLFSILLVSSNYHFKNNSDDIRLVETLNKK